MTAETVKLLNPDGTAHSTAAHGPRADFRGGQELGVPFPPSPLPLPFGLSLGFYASMLLCLTWPPGSSYSNDLTVRSAPSCAPAVKSYDAAKNAR